MKRMTKAAFLHFMKSHGASLICLLLSVAICIGAVSSYSRYVSGDQFYDQPGVGTFAGSGTVVDVSSLTFTNMAFWGGLEDIGVSMNSLRTLSFVVNNRNTSENGISKVSDVSLEYALMFTAPQNFAGKLALQLHDSEGTTLTPQFLLSDIISHAGGEYKTSDPKYNGKDYVSKDEHGNTTSYITFDVMHNEDTGTYTATSKGQDGTVIKLEPVVMKDLEQTLYFRLWDVSNQKLETVTDEKGTLLPPLVVTYKEDVPCYKITISQPGFVFPAGVFTEHRYSMTLAPTDALLDDKLGGFLMKYDAGNDTYQHITQMSPGEEFFISTIAERITSSNKTSDSVTLMGSIPSYYQQGNVETNDLGAYTREIIIEDVLSEVTSSSKTDTGATSYYRKQGNTWTTSTQSRATRSLRKDLITTTTVTTIYHVKIREVTRKSETVTTGSIIYENGEVKQVNQTFVETDTTERVLIDAAKHTKTEVTHTISTYYQTRTNTYGSWTTSATTDVPQNRHPADPLYDHIHPVETDAVPLSADEIAVFSNKEEVRRLLQGETNTQNHTRTITYTSTISPITITGISTMAEGVSTSPFRTHPTSHLQTYYVSPSYSKNYPLFVQIFIRQIQD